MSITYTPYQYALMYKRFMRNNAAIRYYLEGLELIYEIDSEMLFSDRYLFDKNQKKKHNDLNKYKLKEGAIGVKLLDNNNRYYYAYHISQLVHRNIRIPRKNMALSAKIDAEVVGGKQFTSYNDGYNN